MSSSVHIDNKGKDILILLEGPTQGLDSTTLTVEAVYPIYPKDFTIHNLKKMGLGVVVSAASRCFLDIPVFWSYGLDSLVIPPPLPSAPPSSLIVAECPKMFDVQSIWGRTFESTEKIFVFKYSQAIFHLGFTWIIYWKSVTRTFLGTFFWAPAPFKRYQNTSGCSTGCKSFLLTLILLILMIF